MKHKLKMLLRLSVLCVLIIGTMMFVSSGEQINIGGNSAMHSDKNFGADFQRTCIDMNDNINQEIFNLPKTYTLPMDQLPAPLPDPNGFTEDTYEDATISVKCWRERIRVSQKTVTANFADVTISHPTQLRTAFAGGQFGTKRMLASKIASINNAVIAVNGDFYNYKSTGLLIRNGTLYREKPYGADVLFIDSDGNFHAKTDKEAVEEGYYKTKKIYQTLSFGPTIVDNGKVLENWRGNFSCGPYGDEPRTAIGQIGPLHYLLCTIDGRMNHSPGVKMSELAKIMANKNCIIAYNLDGGQSSVLYFHNKPYNIVADGGERTLSDIVYFATAIPQDER